MAPVDAGDGPGADLAAVFRAEHGRVVASLTRRFGDLDLAEDATSEALLLAAERWPAEGLPPNPGGWLTTVAGNKALDRLRREKRRQDKYAEVARMNDRTPDQPPEPTGPVEDDRLRLVFTCCHPALAPENRVALTLRMLGGLTVPEIAAAFLVPETTMAQRITRSKQKIKAAHIPYRIPTPEDLPERLAGVLSVLYLVFNEGYLGSSGEALRTDLTAEAIRLARQLLEMVRATPSLGPVPEVEGLLALMLLVDSRAPARVRDGVLVPLDEQDRTLWDAAKIDEGHRLVRGCLALNRPGPYQLQAAINAVHTDALEASMTDWSQVLQLFDQLLAVTPNAVVALNRAVAVAELDGPERALALVEPLQLQSYHAWHATRADLLRRLERDDEARLAYDRSIELAGNEAERQLLRRRRDRLR
ncbi:MAG: sigma-70 family RNA polymerase sigma factor [Marmoricola sp.]